MPSILHLQVTVYWPSAFQVTTVNAVCLLGGQVSSGSICEYTFTVAGLSIVVTACTALFLCLTCDFCGVGSWFQVRGQPRHLLLPRASQC